MRKKRIINIVGFFLIAVSAVFLIRRIVLLNVDLTDILTLSNAGMILIIALLSVATVFINSYCWRLCLGLFTEAKIPISGTFSVYARANIMKYLPGNVGHYAGRQLYGSRLGIKQSQLAIATVLELMYSSLGLVICAFSFSAKSVLQALCQRFSGSTIIWVGIVIGTAAVLICIFIFVFRKNKYVHAMLELVSSIRFWGVFFVCALLYVIGFAIPIMGFVVLLRQRMALSMSELYVLISANYAAIFVGYVTPGVPGGIGVRETMLTALLSPYFPESTVILTAFSQRIAMILMDLLAVPVSSLFQRINADKSVL